MSEREYVRRGSICFLRRVKEEDAEPFYRWYCDGRVQVHLANPWWNPKIDFDAYRLFRFSLYLVPNELSGVLTICTLEEQPIGLVNYYDIDEESQSCEIGIIIGEVDLWRRGYASESLRLALEYLAGELEIRTVKARILKENEASQELFVKVGFVMTGTSSDQDFEFFEYQYANV